MAYVSLGMPIKRSFDLISFAMYRHRINLALRERRAPFTSVVVLLFFLAPSVRGQQLAPAPQAESKLNLSKVSKSTTLSTEHSIIQEQSHQASKAENIRK